VRTSASWLQPADGREKFHEVAQFSGNGPLRSWWPTIAEPSPLFVQAPQVVSCCGAKAVPSARVPVRKSCSFGVSLPSLRIGRAQKVVQIIPIRLLD